MIKVSIIVPVCNVEKYLFKCLESLRTQHLKEVEFICINDGSKDNSLHILREFESKDSRFKVIDKPNSGYGHTMNLGLSMVSGEYVGIIESDDFIDPEMFSDLYQNAVQYNVDVVKSSFNYYWSTPVEKFVDAKIIPLTLAGKVLDPQKNVEILDIMPSIWSGIYRTKFLRENEIRFLESPGASYQDLGFNVKVWTSATSTVLLPRTLLHYRQDNLNSSVKSAAKVYAVCDEFKEIDEFISRKKNLNREFVFKLNFFKFITYLWNYLRLSSNSRSDFFKVLRAEAISIYEIRSFNVKDFNLKTLVAFLLIVKCPSVFRFLVFLGRK